MANPTSYCMDEITTVYSTPVHTLGQLVEVDGQEYRFIQNGDTDTATSGMPVACENYTDSKWVGCYDLDDGVDGAILGVVMADMTTGEYGWVMRNGVYETCTVGGDVIEGNEACAQTTDGVFRAATAGELFYVCGVVMETVSSTEQDGVAIFIKGI